jgi:ABC-2 type transport system permease protein
MNTVSRAPLLQSPFAWLIRRELWENRYVWLVPVVVALAMVALAVVGWLFFGHDALHIDSETLEAMHGVMTTEQVAPYLSMGLTMVVVPFLIIVLVIQTVYACDALYGERRDRSILFYKSLPVSDTATVLAKAVVAAVVVPVAAILATLLTQVLLAVLTSLELYRVPLLVAALWSPRVWGSVVLMMAYLIVVLALWWLPFAALYLLISARAKRAPLLWVILLVSVVPIAEWIALRTHYVGSILLRRLMFYTDSMDGENFGAVLHRGMHGAPDPHPPLLSSVIAPVHFFSSPGLWAGLVAAAVMIAGAVWLRQRAEASS